MKPVIKIFNKSNVSIRITDFELLDVSFYGCDARFDFEIRDRETDVLLDTSLDIVQDAFPGIDDSEDLYEFLEEKGIDFSADYDDDYDKLPAEMLREFEQREQSMYDDMYHEWFFESDEQEHASIIEKIKDNLYPFRGDIYVIRGEEVAWIEVSYDYFGYHLKGEGVNLQFVYDMGTQKWIYEIDGVFFDLFGTDSCQFALVVYEREEDSRYVVTADDLLIDAFPYFDGDEGDVIYYYHPIS